VIINSALPVWYDVTASRNFKLPRIYHDDVIMIARALTGNFYVMLFEQENAVGHVTVQTA
jgi:hypothetical protein